MGKRSKPQRPKAVPPQKEGIATTDSSADYRKAIRKLRRFVTLSNAVAIISTIISIASFWQSHGAMEEAKKFNDPLMDFVGVKGTVRVDTVLKLSAVLINLGAIPIRVIEAKMNMQLIPSRNNLPVGELPDLNLNNVYLNEIASIGKTVTIQYQINYYPAPEEELKYYNNELAILYVGEFKCENTHTNETFLYKAKIIFGQHGTNVIREQEQ